MPLDDNSIVMSFLSRHTGLPTDKWEFSVRAYNGGKTFVLIGAANQGGFPSGPFFDMSSMRDLIEYENAA
jgi:hypothetical protein